MDKEFIEKQKMPLAVWFAGLESCGVKKSDYVHLLEMQSRYGTDCIIQGNRETVGLAAKSIIMSKAVPQESRQATPAATMPGLLPTQPTTSNRSKLRL
jgi:hypothetical protein